MSGAAGIFFLSTFSLESIIVRAIGMEKINIYSAFRWILELKSHRVSICSYFLLCVTGSCFIIVTCIVDSEQRRWMGAELID